MISILSVEEVETGSYRKGGPNEEGISYDTAEVFRSGVLGSQRRPMHYEIVCDRLHESSTEG